MTAQPPELPEVGVRVSLRYLRPPGSEPAMGDVIGQLLEAGPRVRVRSADGAVHEFRHADVLYARRLTDRPVKNSAIRSVEHAAALAWPGSEHQWLDGWFLRAGPGADLAANSAVPLDMFAHVRTIPAIIDWYAQRGLPPTLAVPERLLRLPDDLPAVHQTRTLVRDLAGGTTPPSVSLTILADGEVAFAWIPGVAFGRGAVTEGSDGTRWLGVSCLRVVEGSRGQAHGRAICAALQVWGAASGATRGYAQAGTEAFGFFEAIGFAGQHRTRYLDARTI